MASTYRSFLASPDASHLASDASINYITTTTTINESAAIIKHLQAQQKQVTKKDEKVLSTIEDGNSLCLETELTIQFNNGGGAFLPSMDENLLDEKLVVFPLLHVVNFDGEQKIKQIRLYWDQATLLKQVEAIGKTGRNWPIRDGKAQVDAITKSVKSGGAGGVTNGSSAASGPRGIDQVVVGAHKKNESVSATRDPHASLNLFATRDPNEHAPGDYQGPKLAPRASAKPAPRNYNELFASGESPSAASNDTGSKVRSPSPSKVDGTILKAGAGKHHAGNRIFDENEPSSAPRSPERKKVFNQKYDHFSFGDGEDAPAMNRPTSNGKTKGGATFSFEDFSTPPKYQRKVRPDDQIHWGQDDPPSPPKRPIVHAPRKENDSHFHFNGEANPGAEPERPTSKHRAQGISLYKDNVVGEQEAEPERPKSNHRAHGTSLYHDNVVYDQDIAPTLNAQSNTTNTNASRRGNDFGAHYNMTDSGGPEDGSTSSSAKPDEQHWAFSAPRTDQKIYKTAGDGMGGRKGGTDWMIGEGEQKIYKTAGDGMGGRSGARSWGIGDDSDPDVQAAKAGRGRGRRG